MPNRHKESALRKQGSVVEWSIALDDADWERRRSLPLADITPAATRRLCLQHACWGVAVLLLLLAGMGGWQWHTSQVEAHPPTADRTVTTPSAIRVPAPDRTSSAPGIISKPADPGQWRPRGQAVNQSRLALQNVASPIPVFGAVRTFEVQGDLAVARVVMYTEDGEPAYRQTRFYRRTGEGWQQTAPDAALWGPQRSLETPSFVFRFHQNDAPAVIAVATQMEAIYITLRRNFGLPVPFDAEKLAIEVSLTQPSGYAATGVGAPNRISVPSPVLSTVPVELTDAELLAQSIALPLLAQVLTQASERYQSKSSWRPLLDGLRLWQVWELDLPLAVWREDVVQWLYVDLPAAGSSQTRVLPKRYTTLCAAHELWMGVPMQIDIPLWCTELDRRAWHPLSRYLHEPPLLLTQFGIPVPLFEYMQGDGEPYRANHPAQVVALATLIEYTVDTYGHERLPALVASLGQYDSWESLIPAVFGVSATEFESGWRIYLADCYTEPIANQHDSNCQHQ